MKNKKQKFDCAEVEKRVQQFIDGALNEEETVLIHEHLDFCLPCDKKIEFEKKLKDFIRTKAGEKSYPPALQTELKKFLK
jgi:anti-sigma factor (TIGR02949 family)